MTINSLEKTPEGLSGEWVKYGFKFSNFFPAVIGLSIASLIFSGLELISSGLGGFIFTLVIWVVISLIALGSFAFAFSRTDRVAVNLSSSQIRLGKEIFAFKQIDYLDMRTVSTPIGYHVGFKIGSGSVRSIVTVALPLRKRVFTPDEYLALCKAIQKFHIPANVQDLGHSERQNTVFTLGKVEASNILKIYASR